MSILNNIYRIVFNLTHAACIIVKYKFLSAKDKFYIKRKMKQLNKELNHG